MRTRPSWRAALGAVASPEHRTLICDEFIYQYQWLSRACESCSARETGGRPGRERKTDTRARRARAPPRAAARESFTPLHTYQNKIFHY
jgi:hypothetical protein